MHNPSIYPFGIRVDEPVTTLTDILVSLASWYAWYRLGQLPRVKLTTSLFRWFFLLMGLGTFFGGVLGHAFLYTLSPLWKLPGWLLSAVSITLLQFAVVLSLRSLLRRFVMYFLIWLSSGQLVVTVYLTALSLDFKYIGFHSAFGLVGVVSGLCIYSGFRNFHQAFSKNMLAGVGLSVIAAVIFVVQTGISKWFTHADIGHVLMFLSVLCFHRGVRHLHHSLKKDSIPAAPARQGP